MRRRRGVGFDDCGWKAIHRALGFVRAHRRHEEIDVGLARDVRGERPGGAFPRRRSGRSSSDRCLVKGEAREPS